MVQYSLVQISPSQMWTAPMQLRPSVVPFSNVKDLGLNYTIEFLVVSEDIPQMSNLRVSFSTLSGSLEVTGVSSTELYVSD